MAGDNRIDKYGIYTKDGVQTPFTVYDKLVATLDIMKQLSKEGINLSNSFKEPKGLQKTIEGTKKVNDYTNKLVVTEKELLKQQQTLAQAEAKRVASMSKANKEIIKSREETKKNNTEIRKQIQLQEATKGSLNRLEKELSQNIQKYKNLTEAERNNQKIGGQLLTTIQKQDKAVKNLNAQLGRAQGNVGNYASALANVGKQLIGALGVTAGIAAFANVLKNTQKVISDFSVAQSTLAALSGKTKDQLSGLTEQALFLGKSTEFTASQATNAQIELVKLGLSVDQITNATPNILKFASATGSELPAAAKTAAVAMRAFGLDASQMGDITSALAVATTKSALSFQDYDTILSTLGPVAKAYGFSLEETIDLTSQLKNAGFDASSAATATRNIMLNLADANGSLAKSLGRPITNIKDLGAGLEELRNKGIDLGEALELTDKRSVAAFNTFLDNAESLGELTTAITGANDELDMMVEKRLDNLQGDVTKLGSAWEGFLLSIEDGNGIFSKLARTIVQFLTNLLGGLTNLMKYKDVIGTIATVTLTYIAALKAQVLWAKRDLIAKAAQNVALKVQTALTKKQTTATIGAEAAQKGLNSAMSANIFAAIATVIIMAVQALIKWNNNLVKARIDTKELTKNIQEESQATNELFDVLKRTTPGSVEYNEAKTKLNELYPTLLKHYDLESGSLTEIEAAQRAANNEVLRNVALREKQNDIQDVAEKANKKFSKSVSNILKMADNAAEKGALASIVGDVTNQIKSGSLSIEEGTKKIAEFLEIPERIGGRTNNQFLMIRGNLRQIELQSNKLNKATDEINTFYTALTGNVIDYKSAFESIDSAKALDQLDGYLTSSDERIKKAAEDRKVLIDELNVAKPVIDKAKSEKELEDYLKSTNELVKEYAEQRMDQLSLTEKNDKLSKKQIELTEKEIKRQEKRNQKIEDADRKSAINRIKIQQDLNKTLDNLDKELIDSLDDDIKNSSEAYDSFWNEQILKAKENAGLFSNNAKEREQAEAELAEKLLQLRKVELQAEIDNGYLSANEQIQAKLEILDIDQQLHDQKMANLDAEAEKQREVTQQSIALIQESFGAISSIYDARSARVEAAYNLEVAKTEEGSAARIAAEEKYDLETRKIARKQAILNKTQGLFNVAISTAQGIMNAYKTFDPITASIFAAIIGGIGAVQAGAILAEPLPAFEKGGMVLEDTLARVSERGAELGISPSGEMFLTPERESIMHLQKGTEIIPHDKTQQLLARQAYANASFENKKTNRILEQIRDKSSDTIIGGYRHVTKNGINGKYKI